MDPNLFHLDWERTAEVVAGVVVLSLFVERALALLFESRWFIKKTRDKETLLKEFIAFLVASAVCWFWDFDAVSMIILRERTGLWGELLTAGVVAGGSKGSVKLFRDVLGFKSSAYKEKEDEKHNKRPPEPPGSSSGTG